MDKVRGRDMDMDRGRGSDLGENSQRERDRDMESDKDRGENPIVDSLAVASDWTIVSKCALHGLIYVFDLKVTAILF